MPVFPEETCSNASTPSGDSASMPTLEVEVWDLSDHFDPSIEPYHRYVM